MTENQYMVQTPDGEMHLVDALTDSQAKSKLSIFLNFKFSPEEMEIFDEMTLESSQSGDK